MGLWTNKRNIRSTPRNKLVGKFDFNLVPSIKNIVQAQIDAGVSMTIYTDATITGDGTLGNPLSAVPVLVGDDWGSQVVQSDGSLSGDGTLGNILSVVDPGWLTVITSDATLTGDGTAGNPLSAVGDDWGIQVVQSDASLNGDGTAGNLLSINNPGWLTTVSTDGTLTGDGTLGSPLSVVAGPSTNLYNTSDTIGSGRVATLTDSLTFTGGAGTSFDVNTGTSATVQTSGTLRLEGNAANDFIEFGGFGLECRVITAGVNSVISVDGAGSSLGINADAGINLNTISGDIDVTPQGDIKLRPTVALEVGLIGTTGYSLPITRGTNNQILVTDASGVVTWGSTDFGVGRTRFLVAADRANTNTFYFNSQTRTSDASAAPEADSAFMVVSSDIDTVTIHMRQKGNATVNATLDVLSCANGADFSTAASITSPSLQAIAEHTVTTYTFSSLSVSPFDLLFIQCTPSSGGSDFYAIIELS